jgi:hypothetical protein
MDHHRAREREREKRTHFQLPPMTYLRTAAMMVGWERGGEEQEERACHENPEWSILKIW